MKRTQLKRKTPLRAKAKKNGVMGKFLGYAVYKPGEPMFLPTKIKKQKLPSVKSARNKADALLTPLIKTMYPLCLLCNSPTEVAHHHVHKSKSTRLRYEIDNLINLCHPCHQRLHHNESYWASRIVAMKGLEWFQRIDQLKNEEVRANVQFYLGHYARLKAMQDELDKMA